LSEEHFSTRARASKARRLHVEFAYAVGLALLSPIHEAAAQEVIPCAACVSFVVAADQARAIAAGSARLDGLHVIVAAQTFDESVRGAIDLLQRAGAVSGIELPLTALSPASTQTVPQVTIVIVDARASSALDDAARYGLRVFATTARAAQPSVRLGIELDSTQLADAAVATLAPYFDVVVLPDAADRAAAATNASGLEIWTDVSRPASSLADLLLGPRLAKSDHALFTIEPGREQLAAAIAGLRTVIPEGATPLPEVTLTCDVECDASVFLHPQTLDAIALVRPRAPVATLTVRPTATALTVYAPPSPPATSVPPGNLRPRQQPPSPSAGTEVPIALPALATPFVVAIRGWRGVTEETFSSEVQVTGARQLQVAEIVARHQTARARQDALIRTDVADASTLLTFQVPGFGAPFTITAATTIFTRAGETTVAQQRIQVNGLDLTRAEGQVPRLPLLEPERVSTPPLAIALTEAYRYALQGFERIHGHDAYVVSFERIVSNRSLYGGRAWIDAETFGLVRTDATQTGLRGPIASSREVADFDRVDRESAPVWLLRRSEVFQVYVGPTETLPIHRVVTFDRHDVNAADYDMRLDAALRSNAVMLRDTPQGYRFLVPNKTVTGADVRRVSPATVDRIVTAILGGLFDPNISVPLVFAGVSYVDFNLFKTGTQVNAFFGGTYARLSWSTPPFLASRWRVAGDGSGVAFAYNDRAFQGGLERYEENIRQRPSQFSVALLGTIRPTLRVRAGYELDYTRYAAADTTAATFVVPASTPVHGLRIALEAEKGPWSMTDWITVGLRQTWTPWGLTPSAAQRDARRFERFGATLVRSIVWSPRAVARVEAAVMGGSRLDRFSRFAFGAFDNPLRGYPSVSIRYDDGAAVRSAATWTPLSRLRIDGFGDIGVARNRDERRVRGYPGVGAAIEAPAPFGWLVAVEWGYGIKGVNTNGTRGTHVVRASGYKVF